MTYAENIERFIAQLESANAWTASAAMPCCATLVELGKEFQEFSLADARRVIELLNQKSLKSRSPGEPVDSWSKIYVLLRFYFKVPESIRRRDAQFFGSWSGVPHDEMTVNLLWPLSLKDGTLKLSGTFQGYYGADYDAIGEFEYFDAHFGRRAPVTPLSKE